MTLILQQNFGWGYLGVGGWGGGFVFEFGFFLVVVSSYLSQLTEVSCLHLVVRLSLDELI